MKNYFRTRKIRMATLSVLVAFAFLSQAFTAVYAAHKLSNKGSIDGITADLESGIHNSYAWCAEVFEQTDGDYLWVGTNRDLGGAIIGAALGADPMMATFSEMVNIPVASADNKGKIYRMNTNSMYDPEWELMYEDPAINGYRKMVIFNGDLYVFAGLSNRRSGYNYSTVYRFGADFKPGDTPEVVLWETLTGTMTEYFRSAYVYEDVLYVGTFDGKIYSTDGAGLAALTPNTAGTGDKYTGWELTADLKTLPNYDTLPAAIPSYVWDIIGFNGSLYAFTAGDGFRVYKLTPDGAGDFDITQIVGNQAEAAYAPGLGLNKHFVASPFISTSFDDEYVYVSTFANGPTFLVQCAAGNIVKAFQDLYCPATVYRFDKDDNWEVVVGDTRGANVAVDSAGDPVPHVGNSRAGFFPGNDIFKNISANQYIWWMAESDGKLYASTWDMGVFRDSIPLMILNVFINEYGMDNVQTVAPYLTELIADIQALYESASSYATGTDFEGAAENTAALLETFIEDFRIAADNTEREELLEKLVQDIGAEMAAIIPDPAVIEVLLANLYTSLSGFVAAFAPTTGEFVDAIPETIAAAFVSALFYFDKSNPSGFDLFVSEDGVNFAPYTVTGLDDQFNYGGRVLLPTSYGFFLMTANPFNGCQVWRLDDVDPAIFDVKAPEEIDINIDDTITFTFKTVAIDSDDVAIAFGEEGILSGSVVLKEVLEPVSVYNPSVKIERDWWVFGTYKYTEEGEYLELPVKFYEVTLKGLAEFDDEMDMTISAGGESVTFTTDVTISLYSEPTTTEITTESTTTEPTYSAVPVETADGFDAILWIALSMTMLLLSAVVIAVRKTRKA